MLLNLVGALDRSRFRPVILAADNGPLVEELRAIDVEIVHGETHSCSLRHPLQLWRRARAAAGKLREWDIDLVHINLFPWNMDIAFGAWLSHLPVVCHCHNPLTIHRSNLVRFATSRILFVSQRERQEAVGLNLTRAKDQVLYNFIDFDYYSSGSSIRATLGLTEQDFVVTTVAQLSARKGIDTVIETARLCRERGSDFRFLIVGGKAVNEAEYADEMRALVVEYDLQEQVQILGPRSDLPDIYASSDILLHPAHQEPFGLVIIEAMAAGLPVVAGAVGGIPEIVGAVGAGTLLEDATPRDFSTALLDIRDMPDWGKKGAQMARAEAHRHFSREAVMPTLEAIYRELLAH